MSAASVSAAATSVGDRIGRNFSLVGLLPSLVFVGYIYLLIGAGAIGTSFDLGLIGDRLDKISFTQVVVLAWVAVLLGVVLHPLQYGMTQILEGYWGPGHMTVELATRRIAVHRDRLLRHKEYMRQCEKALFEYAMRKSSDDERSLARADSGLRWDAIHGIFDGSHDDDSLDGDLLDDEELRDNEPIRHYLRHEAARFAAGKYPRELFRLLPTRLGNALRAFEDNAGRQYGLQIIPIAQHLYFVSDPEQRAFAADTKQQLDLSVRMCALALLATPATAILLADDGWWALITLLPYVVAYFAYRGAVAAAEAYGSAVTAVLDLNRFGLYERLHIPLPSGPAAERAQNQQLMQLLTGDDEAAGPRYEHGPSTS